MKITDIRISVLPKGASPVCAYCTVSFDHQLAVHDLRIIRSGDRLFVAMPNRKRTEPCKKCQTRNASQSKFCSNCGIAVQRPSDETPSNSRHHLDIAHPLTAEFRADLEREIIDCYQKNLDLGLDSPGEALREGA